MLQKKVVEKIEAHFPEYHAVYEIMWENMVESERPQITTPDN
jgi:hypothetical protein